MNLLPGHLPADALDKDDLPIVDQYTYLGVEISKDCSWDAHIAKVIA